MNTVQLAASWNYPTDIRIGANRIRELPACCEQLGITAPLLVTDPALADLPMITDVLSACRSQGLRCKLFTDVHANPTEQDVLRGVKAYRDGDHDGVIAFGGGSSLDAGKAVALMSGQNRPLWDFVDEGDNWQRANIDSISPVIAVPTTAGTGSEVGRASVIVDESAREKKLIFHPRMMPSIAILDPLLTSSLPPHLTAATGMDALSHNLEAYCSPLFHPLATGIALEGIRLVLEHLPAAVRDGDDINARAQMLAAASMGATAFQKGLGAMHALAHPLGALYGTHHGLLNAILMPYVLAANRTAIESRIGRLANYLGLANPGFDDFLGAVLDLRQKIEIPNTLAEVGIEMGDSAQIGALAAADPSAATNPIPFTEQEYSAVFEAAVRGKLLVS